MFSAPPLASAPMSFNESFVAGENADPVNSTNCVLSATAKRDARLTFRMDGPTIILIETPILTRLGGENGDRAATR